MKILKESEVNVDRQKIQMHHKVFRKVFDKIDQDFDNYAVVLASELPGYNSEWCAEAMTSTEIAKARAQNTFAQAVTDMLLANM